ncbi:MAG: DUF177 domain-containing protein [Ignavibacteriae bacterium]|nr:DUF177 domain-containing protein [Ignavibacteriota bacterium]
MKIQIGGLSEGIHQYSFQVPSSEVELGEHFHGDVHVEATLDKTTTQLLLKANIRTVGRFECDRCTAEFDASLDPSYQMCYVTEADEYPGIDPDEMQVIPTGLSVIDIGEDVRQMVLLAVPLKLLCKEACKGLCPHCGTNLNIDRCSCEDSGIDSRWEKLRRIQNN